MASCHNILTILTLRWKIFLQDVWMGQMCDRCGHDQGLSKKVDNVQGPPTKMIPLTWDPLTVPCPYPLPGLATPVGTTQGNFFLPASPLCVCVCVCVHQKIHIAGNGKQRKITQKSIINGWHIYQHLMLLVLQ